MTALGAATLSLPAGASTALISSRPKPNFLFIITDQQIAQAISACSPELPLQTPNIDRLVRRGTRFSTFRSANPLCSPSRSAMFTGRMPSETGVVRNGMSIREDIPNLGQWFGQNGYETVYTGKWHLPKLSPMPNQGFKIVPTTGITGNGHFGDASTSRTCEGYLRNRTGSDPFFLVSSFLQPHDICEWIDMNWDGANRLLFPEAAAGGLPPLPANFAYDHREPTKVAKRPRPNWTPEQWGYYLWSYYHHVEMVDAEVGRVLNALEDSGQADNTVIFFVSDHGEGCGHHRNVLKNNPYEEALRVPLIISWPGQVGEGKTDEHLSSGYDLMPTFCDFAGIKPPPRLVGRSLKPWAQGNRAEGGDMAVAELQVSGRVISTREFKFVSYKGDPVEQLFDLVNDPGETKNLAGDAAHAPTVTEYRKLLADWEGRLDPAHHSKT
jgi:choline-sulfatase